MRELPEIMQIPESRERYPLSGNNRRILNATPAVTADGIEVKSKLEARIYDTLLTLGYEPRYEQESFTYWEGLKPTVPFYDLGKNRKLRLNMTKLIDMKYTPDIIFDYEGIKVIIEVKGYANDQFAIRKKMFRAYLETVDYAVIYAEIFTKKQLLEFLDCLKEYSDNLKLKEHAKEITL